MYRLKVCKFRWPFLSLTSASTTSPSISTHSVTINNNSNKAPPIFEITRDTQSFSPNPSRWIDDRILGREKRRSSGKGGE